MKFFLYFETLLAFLPYLDCYQHKVDFLVNSKGGVRSRIGGIFSIFLAIVAFYSFFNYFQSWINGQQLRMISKYDSLTIDEIKLKNSSLSFDWDHSNYNLYFSIGSRVQIDSETLRNVDLQRYLTFYILYFDTNSTFGRNIEWEYCSQRKRNEFLELNDNSQNDSVSFAEICIKEGQQIKFGYTYDQGKRVLNSTQLQFIIQKCVNSTANRYSCAPEEEIKNIINMAIVQVSLPKSYYDFNDPLHTRKRSFDYQHYYLDPKLLYLYSNYVLPIFLSTDHGLINTDYQLDSVDFNGETLTYQANSEMGFQSSLLFVYIIRPSFNQQFYYRKNENIFWLFSSLGGTLNFFFGLGSIFIYFYNSLVLKHKLVSIAFSSAENTNKDNKETQAIKAIGLNEKKIEEKKIKFSFLNLLCPRFFKNHAYSAALRDLQDYMDIKNVIRRLQELDKIKMILFDEQGLKEFEDLPKPMAKPKENHWEASILSQPQIFGAIEKSLYLKNLRCFLNDTSKKMGSLDNFNHLKNISDLENPSKVQIFDCKDSERKEFIQVTDVPEEKLKEEIEMRSFACKEKINLNK